MTISILSLHTYPVKSCGSITHTQVRVSATGLEHDREWVVVDTAGNFLTQRVHPHMALVQPELDGTALFLNAPEMPTLRVSLQEADPGSPSTPLRIWKSSTLGQDEGETAARWFSDYMGLPCRLYRVHRLAQRLADPQRVFDWQQHNQVNDFPLEHPVGFADGFPLLVTNQASLEDLNQRLAARDHAPVPMNRFRPNIVIQGLEAYEEDYLSSLTMGELTLAMVKRCTRCPMPNVDQQTGQAGVEPMATLRSYRSFESGVLFGVNAVLAGARPDTTFSVGNALESVLDI